MGTICSDHSSGRNFPNETIHRFTQYTILEKEEN